MADSLSIAVTADTTSLRAQLALAQADLRSFSTELRNTANAARQAGGATDPKLAAAAGQYATAAGQVSKLKSELNELSGIGKKAGESLTEGFRLVPGVVLRIREHLGGLKEAAEAVGVAFAAERLVEWSLEAAEAGERAVNMAAAIGTSTERYSELSQAMKLAGGDAETANRSFQLLAQHAEDSLQEPLSKASEAFNKLGVSTADLEDALKDPTTLIDRLAEGFQRLEQAGRGGEAIAALRELAGRGNFALVAAIREGADGIARFKQEVQDTGAVVSDSLGAEMVETTEKVHLLGEAWEGMKDIIYEQLHQPINDALDSLTGFLETLDGAKKAAFAKQHSVANGTGGGWWESFLADVGVIPDMGDVEAVPDASTGFRGAADARDPARSVRTSRAQQELQYNNFAGMFEPGTRNLQRFGTPNAGVEAIGKQLDLYQSKYGVNTLGGMVSRWAPPSDHNDTEALIARASKITGLGAGDQVNLQDPAMRRKTIEAFIRNERGGQLPSAAASALGSGAGSLSWPQADAANKARFQVQRADVDREMEDAQRKLMGGDAGAQAPYQAAAAKLKAIIDQEVAYETMGRDQKIAMAEAAAGGQTAAAIKAADEIKRVDEEIAKSGDALASRRIEAAEKAASIMRKVNADWLKQYQTGITAQVKSGDLTARQGYGYDIQAVRSVSGKDIAGLSSVANTPGATPDQVTGAQAQIGELKAAANVAVAEFNEKIVADAKATADAWAAPFKKEINGIGSAFESGIAGILEHKETGRKFATSMRDSLISGGTGLIGTGLNKAGGALLGGDKGQGVGDVLGDKLGSLIQSGVTKMIPSLATKGVDTISQATTMATSVTTPLTGVLTGLGTTLVTAIQLSAAEIVGAVTVNTVNPEVLGNKFSGGGIVPRFAFGGIVHRAAGGWHVPSSFGTDTVPAMLTPGEHVLPTNLAKAYQAGADALNGGGGAPSGDVHVHHHYEGPADAPAMARLTGKIKGEVISAIRSRMPT